MVSSTTAHFTAAPRLTPQTLGWLLGALGVFVFALTIPMTRLASGSLAVAWGGFLCASVFSVGLGFFAWYRGLQLGGMLRVSQIQRLQPFLSMALAVPLLGEALDAMTVAFALAVMATVFLSRRMATTVVVAAPVLR